MAEMSAAVGMSEQSGMNVVVVCPESIEVADAELSFPEQPLATTAMPRSIPASGPTRLRVMVNVGLGRRRNRGSFRGACTSIGRLGARRERRYPSHVALDEQKLPIKMLNDRLLVRIPERDGERRSSGGILIPATAQISKRLTWAEVVALGQNVRAAEVGDRVLFSPEDRYEVEVGGADYIMLRERDIHAVAASRIEASTGLYL
jgi:chaperonin GroES